jgi:hypothetical protein
VARPNRLVPSIQERRVERSGGLAFLLSIDLDNRVMRGYYDAEDVVTICARLLTLWPSYQTYSKSSGEWNVYLHESGAGDDVDSRGYPRDSRYGVIYRSITPASSSARVCFELVIQSVAVYRS